MAGFLGGRTAALYKEGEAQDEPVLTSLSVLAGLLV